MSSNWLEQRIKALKCWKKIVSYTYDAPREGNIIITARRGEEFIKKYISTKDEFRNCAIHYCSRLENSDKKCNEKFDLIIRTEKKIYAIEFNDWNGNIKIDGDKWEYTIFDSDGKKITQIFGPKTDICDPATNLQKKSKMLYDTLKKNGVSLNKDKVVSKIFFTNRNMYVENAQDHCDIITYDDISEYTGNNEFSKNSVENIVIALLRLFLYAESLSKINNKIETNFRNDERDTIDISLDSLSPFDYVKLSPYSMFDNSYADKLKTYQGNVVNYDSCFWESEVDMKLIKKIKINRPINQLVSLFMVLFGFFPLTARVTFTDDCEKIYEINPDGYIQFQETGCATSINIPVLQIDETEINLRPGVGNNGHLKNWGEKVRDILTFWKRKNPQ